MRMLINAEQCPCSADDRLGGYVGSWTFYRGSTASPDQIEKEFKACRCFCYTGGIPPSKHPGNVRKLPAKRMLKISQDLDCPMPSILSHAAHAGQSTKPAVQSSLVFIRLGAGCLYSHRRCYTMNYCQYIDEQPYKRIQNCMRW